jgi:hypothetical protein
MNVYELEVERRGDTLTLSRRLAVIRRRNRTETRPLVSLILKDIIFPSIPFKPIAVFLYMYVIRFGCGSLRGTGFGVFSHIESVRGERVLMVGGGWHSGRSQGCGGFRCAGGLLPGTAGACVKEATVSRLVLSKASKTTGGGGRGVQHLTGAGRPCG